jgi:hypothetical protein
MSHATASLALVTSAALTLDPALAALIGPALERVAQARARFFTIAADAGANLRLRA